MKRTLWKWAAPAAVLATVAVWGWAQDANLPVPAAASPGSPASRAISEPYNPGIPADSPGGSTAPLVSQPSYEPLDSLAPTPVTPGEAMVWADVIDSSGVRSRIPVVGSPRVGAQITIQLHGQSPKTYTVVSVADTPQIGWTRSRTNLDMQTLSRGSGPYRPVVTRRSITETHMVPLTAEEVLEAKQFQDLLKHIGDTTKTDAEKEVGRKQLAELLEKQFNRDFETREKDVVELEERVKKLREQLDKRKAAKEKIIELRQMTILNSLDGLGFPEMSGAGVGSGAEIFSSGVSLPPGMTAPPAGLGGTSDGNLPGSGGPFRDSIPLEPMSESEESLDGAPGVLMPRPVDPDSGGTTRKVPAKSVPVRGEDPITAVDAASDAEPEEQPDGGNLIRNPSFDQLNGPNDWTSDANSATGANPGPVGYSIDPKGGVNGTAAARIHKTENTYFPIMEWTRRINHDSDIAAKYIELSAMVKTKDATKAVLDVLFLDDKGEWVKHEWAAYIGDQSIEPKPLTHDFKEYKGTVAIPANTKTIVIGLQDYGPGEIWFDDVSAVYKQEAPALPTNVQ